VSGSSTHWLPRADGDNGRGDSLRRSFQDRLERREEGGGAAAAVACLERLRIVELERRAALAAIADLSEDERALLASVLALPAEPQTALAALLRERASAKAPYTGSQ
jgi:hypothetical protein